jgi:hypothetical protein
MRVFCRYADFRFRIKKKILSRFNHLIICLQVPWKSIWSLYYFTNVGEVNAFSVPRCVHNTFPHFWSRPMPTHLWRILFIRCPCTRPSICPVTFHKFQGERLVESNKLLVCVLGASMGRFLSKIGVYRFSICPPRPLSWNWFPSILRRTACTIELILRVRVGGE